MPTLQRWDAKGRIASIEVTNGRGIREKLEYDYRDGEDEEGGYHASGVVAAQQDHPLSAHNNQLLP